MDRFTLVVALLFPLAACDGCTPATPGEDAAAADGTAGDAARADTAGRDASGADQTIADAGSVDHATGDAGGFDHAIVDAGNFDHTVPASTCAVGVSEGVVQAPVFVRNLSGQTSWFASPIVADLDHDTNNELIAAYYDVYVFAADGTLLDTLTGGTGRVYAPHVVADLDDDGITEIVYGSGNEVYAYEWISGHAQLKTGWPVTTTSSGSVPEVRGLAAADLDGDHHIEVIATTTQTLNTSMGGAQVFVFNSNGSTYQPAGGPTPAWPRYDNLTGDGHDADRNGAGHSGYGCYGLNVGVGNIDNDSELEIIVTYDNHEIQAFNHDGVAIDASDYYTNPGGTYLNQRLTWGQFIRWADAQVEADHYNLHTGTWPGPSWTEWLQWTASPPSVADIDGDGHAEVIGVPNIELHDPYETQAYGVFVLEGAFGDGSRSARRKPGWETLPRGDAPIPVSGWYPPLGVPAPALVDITGDSKLEIVVSLNDGYLYAFGPSATRRWRYDYRHGKAIMFASEPTIADLNQDGSPEVLFATYGDPAVTDSGNLVVLSAGGGLLHDVALPNPGNDGNGNGAPAAPAVYDLDGDGALEIFVQTFDHGLDVFRVPGSADNCVLWPTARGGPLRTGAAHRAP